MYLFHDCFASSLAPSKNDNDFIEKMGYIQDGEGSKWREKIDKKKGDVK